jgi:hypothetical protein
MGSRAFWNRIEYRSAVTMAPKVAVDETRKARKGSVSDRKAG